MQPGAVHGKRLLCVALMCLFSARRDLEVLEQIAQTNLVCEGDSRMGLRAWLSIELSRTSSSVFDEGGQLQEVEVHWSGGDRSDTSHAENCVVLSVRGDSSALLGKGSAVFME